MPSSMIRKSAIVGAALLLLGGLTSAVRAQQPHYSSTYGQDRAQI